MTIAIEQSKIAVEPGYYHNVPFTDYIRWDAVNWHTLQPFAVSAKFGRKSMLTRANAKDHQVFGEAFHAAILEPDRFAAQYAFMPEFEGHHNSNAYKAKVAAWEAEHANAVTLTYGEYGELKAMQKAVQDHPKAGPILCAKGKSEISLVWRDTETGLLSKCRIDWLARIPTCLVDLTATPKDQTLCLVDLKTTRHPTLDGFNRDRAKFCYHAQLAMQLDGLKTFNAAEIFPMLLGIHNEGDDVFPCDMRELIPIGRHIYRGLLRTYAKCQKEKHWPGASEEVVPLHPFRWELSEHEITEEED